MRNRYFYIFILILIAIITHIEWFNPSSILSAGDWFHWPQQLVNHLDVSWSTWLSYINFGSTNIQIYFYLFTSLWSLLGLVGVPYDVALKLTILIPIAIGGFLTPYTYIYGKTREPYIAFVGSVFWASTTYFLMRQTAHLLIAFIYAFTPLFFYILDKLYKKRGWHYGWIIFVILFSIGIGYELRIMFIVSILLFFYFLIQNHHSFYTYRKIIFTTSITLIGLNLYWILPTFAGGLSSDVAMVANRGLFGNHLFTLNTALTISDFSWTGSYPEQNFLLHPIQLHLFIIPILICLSSLIYFNDSRERRLFLYYLLLCVCGILLTKQSAAPFMGLYEQLYVNVPGFSLFREASKFYLITAFGMMGAISMLLIFLLQNKKMYLYYGASFLVIFVAFINFIPLITKDVGTMFVSNIIHDDYRIFSEKFFRDLVFSRVLWVPRNSRWSFYDDRTPRLSAASAGSKDWSKLIKSNDAWNNENSAFSVISLLQNAKYADALFDISQIKYVAVPIEDFSNNDGLFMFYGGRENPNIRQWYINQLDALPYLKRVDIGTKELVVYENKGYLPYIRAMATPNQYDSFGLLNNKYVFSNNMLERPFDFFVSTTTAAFPAIHTQLAFENVTPRSLKENMMIVPLNHIGDMRLYLPPGTQLTKDNDGSFTIIPSSHTDTRSLLDTSGYARKILESTTSTTLRYTALKPFTNIVQNPSFEDGFWQTNVGDCNAYDDMPILAMSTTSNAHSGRVALELSATRHIACTNQKVPIEDERHYLFSFAYQSSNAKEAGYYIGYTVVTPDGSTTTRISEKIPVKKEGWQEFNKIIDTPKNAVSASLYFYSYSKDDTTPIVTRYDDVSLIELPDDIFDYWLVARPRTAFVEPRDVTFDIVSPTKKLVHIKGATTPFYLAMSESYHPQWQLEMNNEKVNGMLRSWVPWIKPDHIDDAMHFELDGFLNGWYVDTAALCTDGQAACIKNSDGSYDMEMVVEFFPQRWFYVGLIISGTTLISCIGYLIVDGMLRLRRRRVAERGA